MKRSVFFILCALFVICGSGSAQDISIVRPTAIPDDTVSLTNTQSTVSGENIISGTGTNTVTLLDRNSYAKSVNLPNAEEVFQSGDEVPLPDLDRPITEGYADLTPGYACKAILNAPYYFQQFKPGEKFTLDVTFINTGTETWDFNIDVMQYSGDRLETANGTYIYDLHKAYKEAGDTSVRIVKPGGAIRFTLEMQAPSSPYHEDRKYYSAYTLVKNWNRYGMDQLRSSGWNEDHHNPQTGEWEAAFNDGEGGMFCPVYFYIYVPDNREE